ncbi:hypothetical protein CMI47_22240 [Candidatus Pacearchaeota archaeon]|nr:hypothetical protein [Candidatus Pacearchaeota archaeon]|tara:strand:- start:17228 stop:17584 length:357 start_codon:yes stop_codon:yes gene_type:complete
MELVVFVGEDKETWGQVKGVMNNSDCERIFLVKDKGTKGFPENSKTDTIDVDCGKPLLELKTEIMDKLKGKLKGDFEVALSIASGNGKEHMALISALLETPVGIRLVVFTQKGIEFVN